ncbi:MAG: selenocysteine-specific translation elongation factor [Acidobacteriota bacterium]
MTTDSASVRSIIVGTAGHIDHGKSALVRALTGKDPDRLPEEKRRGITIDLGFADLDLGEVRIGFVDVPGHERFVKNMLAGAHGIDVVALVIAADEGVMPQTREHFDICRLLGVQRGLIVVTKIDLVEEELLPLVHAEAEELIAGSFLERAPVLNVSAKTSAGLDELRETLREIALHVTKRPERLIPRLPVDRAFAMKGFGAVVTGTLVSGTIAEGDELELLPSLARVRARGLQVYGKSVEQAVAGQRTAVNLGGIDTAAIERGMVLAPIGRLRTTQILDVHLTVLDSAPRPLRSRARVHFHIHGAEALATVRVLSEGGEIAPGESGLAQLRLEAPVVAVSEERFILRSYSPSQTSAGGEVLDPFALKHRGKDLALVRHRLLDLMNAEPNLRLRIFIASSGEIGQRHADLAARTGWNDNTLKVVLAETTASGDIVDCGGVFVSQETFARLKLDAVEEVAAHHKREPLARGLARETLRERRFGHSPPEIFRTALAALEQSGTLVSERDLVRTHEHLPELSSGDLELRDKLEQVFEQAGLEPPALEQGMQLAGVNAAQRAHGRKLLQLLLEGGSLVRVQGELFFHRKALDGLIGKLREFAVARGPQATIDVASFKDLAGVSRKYAIPLLEFLDRERITRRTGDRRMILG